MGIVGITMCVVFLLLYYISHLLIILSLSFNLLFNFGENECTCLAISAMSLWYDR